MMKRGHSMAPYVILSMAALVSASGDPVVWGGTKTGGYV